MMFMCAQYVQSVIQVLGVRWLHLLRLVHHMLRHTLKTLNQLQQVHYQFVGRLLTEVLPMHGRSTVDMLKVEQIVPGSTLTLTMETMMTTSSLLGLS